MLGLTTQKASVYPEPTIQEMMGLAVDFGIMTRVRWFTGRVTMDVLGEPMELTEEEVAILLKGLLLGYFYNQKRDDLSLAEWEK